MLTVIEPSAILRDARQASGMSVRALADAAGVSASTIHRIERGDMQPTIEMLRRLLQTAGRRLEVRAEPDCASSVAGLALEVRGDLARHDESGIVRKASELTSRFRTASAEDRRQMLAARPVPTGDVHWDAFVAALAEWLAVGWRSVAPGWVHDRSRFLSRGWWVTPMRSMRAWEYAGSPAAFQARGVFIHRDSLVNT